MNAVNATSATASATSFRIVLPFVSPHSVCRREPQSEPTPPTDGGNLLAQKGVLDIVRPVDDHYQHVRRAQGQLHLRLPAARAVTVAPRRFAGWSGCPARPSRRVRGSVRLQLRRRASRPGLARGSRLGAPRRARRLVRRPDDLPDPGQRRASYARRPRRTGLESGLELLLLSRGRPRPVFPSAFVAVAPGEHWFGGHWVGLAVRCPVCEALSVNLVSQAHVDLPFSNDGTIGVVDHVFPDDALRTVEAFRSELGSSRLTRASAAPELGLLVICSRENPAIFPGTEAVMIGVTRGISTLTGAAVAGILLWFACRSARRRRRSTGRRTG